MPAEWVGGNFRQLNLLPGAQFGVAYGVNNNGVVVGYTQGAGQIATEWTNGIPTPLVGLSGAFANNAFSVNDKGNVVGYSYAGQEVWASEWTNGSVVNLGGLPGSQGSEAFDINSNDDIVGYSVFGNKNVATEWSGGTVINLGMLSGAVQSEAYGINNRGDIVGISEFVLNENGNTFERARPTVWLNGVPFNLILPPGAFEAFANDINDNGQIVGTGIAAGSQILEWNSGIVRELNNPFGNQNLPFYESANAINELGQVVGTAVPEASSSLMALLGFCTFTIFRRHLVGSVENFK